VPVSVCRALGARIVIAVNLHGESFGRGATVFDPGEDELDALPEPVVPRRRRARQGERPAGAPHAARPPAGAPGLTTVMVEAFNITQDRIARSRLAGDPPDVMIAPRLGRIGLFEFHRAVEAIELGEEAAERAIGDIALAMKVLA
jgi:NTE family protein